MLNGNISRLLKLTRIFFNYFLENLSKQIINLGGHVSSDIIIVICHSARRIMASSPQENIKGSTGDEGQNSETKNEEKKDDSIFECNICLDTARDAVVSMCGHLFCWPCLHQWLETRPNRQVCPVCKAAISKEKVVPLYGRGSTKQEDPREKVPPRPAGQRTEPEPGSSFPGFGFGDNSFHMSFGIGAFPFGFFTSTFNFGEPRPAAAAHGTHQHMEEQFLSKIFLWLAILFLTWLLMA